MSRDILITSALNYANGRLHLGHMLEVIQADIWARFQRLRGHHCLYLSGADAHGTPIMLAAQKAQVAPENLIETMRATHQEDFAGFLVDVANYHTTHSAENRALSESIYRQLQARGDISRRTILQAYDPVQHLFLPDRFIRGTCPKCGAADQYGDNCEACGTTYEPMDLLNPVSVLSGATPVVKESEHYFFHTDHHRAVLQAWIDAGHLQPEVANKLKEWFHDELKPWDISRDAPYFGFEIPDAPGKFFYVWLDAPIGYIASLADLATREPSLSVDNYWGAGSTAEIYHFIGKDIAYFHALFWPAMLHGANLRLPTSLFVHGYLTINGQKMSKSRGTFITAAHYLAHADPEFLRYYFAAKLSPRIEDIDLNLDDFAQRTNADLVGKFVNLASRCAGFIEKRFEGQLSSQLDDVALFNEVAAAAPVIADFYETRDYNKAVRQIMALVDLANQYIDQQKPWALAKDPAQADKVQAVCTQGLNLFRQLMIYLKPILPKTALAAEHFLACPALQWDDVTKPWLGRMIKPFTPLLQRVTPDTVAALLSA